MSCERSCLVDLSHETVRPSAEVTALHSAALSGFGDMVEVTPDFPQPAVRTRYKF